MNTIDRPPPSKPIVGDPMAIPANLDAFLPREDFYADPDPTRPADTEFDEIGLADLRDTYWGMMRKPDFQRTTAAWDPKRIAQFIKSFCENDLIPGVIFWNSTTTKNILVVDGAHRISALLAWIQDDYGDRGTSIDFLGNHENGDQIAAAEATRKQIEKVIGSYKDIWTAIDNPDAKPQHKELCPAVRKRKIKVQWVRGDAKKVTESFFRINLQGVSLNRIEKKLIINRTHPVGIATRVIVQCGAGHPYWKDFAEKDKTAAIDKGKEIHSLLFSPPLKHPVTHIHLPIGGKAHAGTSMELTLELVEFSNPQPAVGALGPVTVHALQNTWKVLSLINGDSPGCLGLHPAVYFYSHATGKHHPTAFMSVVKWISSLTKEQIMRFSVIRKEFEQFLILKPGVIKEIISRRGSSNRAVPTLVDYYNLLFSSLELFRTESEIFEEMKQVARLAPFAAEAPDFSEYGKDFSSEVKSYGFIRDALNAGPECGICGARYHPNSANADHILPKSQGGIGAPTNHRTTHFYCNSSRGSLEPLIEQRKQHLKELF